MGLVQHRLPVRALLLEALFLAAEREGLQPAHVVRRQDGGQEAEDPQRLEVGEGVVEHVALGPEARQRRDAGDGQEADGEGDRGPLHVAAQRAHPFEVLFVLQPVDHRAGAQEEQALEEGVRHHEEDGGDVGARADRQDHVADLRDGREGQDLLDVLLRAGDGGRDEGGHGPDDGDDLGPRGRDVQQGVHPAQQIDPRRDHGGGVNEGGDRRRALHGVGQPVEERDLGRLAGGGQEQEQHRRQADTAVEVAELAEDAAARAALVLERPGPLENQEDGEQEADITDAVVDEGLLAGRGGGLLLEPEGHQPVGADAHAFPTDEGQQQVVRQHQQQHGEDEQVQVDEELGVVAVVLHVPDGVQVDERAHEGDEHAHRDRQRVHQRAHGDRQPAHLEPGEEVVHHHPAVVGQAEQPGQDEAGHHEGARRWRRFRPRRPPGRRGGDRRSRGPKSPRGAAAT